MPTLKTMMKRNDGLVGHLSVAEALELDADDVAEWADGAQLPCVDGVRVFMAEDVAELELQLDGDDDDDGDDEIDSVDNADYGANGAENADLDGSESDETSHIEGAHDGLDSDDDDGGERDDDDDDADQDVDDD